MGIEQEAIKREQENNGLQSTCLQNDDEEDTQ